MRETVTTALVLLFAVSCASSSSSSGSGGATPSAAPPEGHVTLDCMTEQTCTSTEIGKTCNEEGQCGGTHCLCTAHGWECASNCPSTSGDAGYDATDASDAATSD